MYAVIAVLLRLLSGFVATPTNFVIADFWRWCVIPMLSLFGLKKGNPTNDVVVS
jgi:hypothetical protein